FAAHVDHAFEAITGRDRGRGDAVLTGTRFSDDALLAQAPRQQDLADAVVDLVGAGVIEVFPLEPDLGAAELFRPALRVIHGARAPHEVLEFVMKFAQEFRVVAVTCVSGLEFVERMHERLGHERAAKAAKVPVAIRKIVGFQSCTLSMHGASRDFGISHFSSPAHCCRALRRHARAASTPVSSFNAVSARAVCSPLRTSIVNTMCANERRLWVLMLMTLMRSLAKTSERSLRRLGRSCAWMLISTG